MFDLITCNPPYIPRDVIPTLMPEVCEYEPIMALDGGTDGLDFYGRIAAEAGDFLRKEGRLICEIGIAPVKPAEFVIFRITQKTASE